MKTRFIESILRRADRLIYRISVRCDIELSGTAMCRVIDKHEDLELHGMITVFCGGLSERYWVEKNGLRSRIFSGVKGCIECHKLFDNLKNATL